MLLQKNNSRNQKVTPEESRAVVNLMRNYIERECMQARVFETREDLENEVQIRLSKLMSQAN